MESGRNQEEARGGRMRWGEEKGGKGAGKGHQILGIGDIRKR